VKKVHERSGCTEDVGDEEDGGLGVVGGAGDVCLESPQVVHHRALPIDRVQSRRVVAAL
jgi:hypothetical protein